MTTVLFACVANAGRSQMAEAIFRLLADPSKARASSAGSAPAEAVHPLVVEAMAEIGVDLATVKPRRLTDELAAGCDWLVTMGCGESCPIVPGVRREDWLLPDPKALPLEGVRALRATLTARVTRFLDENGWRKPIA